MGPPKTSEPCALAKRVLATPTLLSTESSLNSCCKVVTSPEVTELVADLSTVRSLLTRTLPRSTRSQVCCPWPTPVQTPTALNSSSPLCHAHGWTVSTLSLVRLLTAT